MQGSIYINTTNSEYFPQMRRGIPNSFQIIGFVLWVIENLNSLGAQAQLWVRTIFTAMFGTTDPRAIQVVRNRLAGVYAARKRVASPQQATVCMFFTPDERIAPAIIQRCIRDMPNAAAVTYTQPGAQGRHEIAFLPSEAKKQCKQPETRPESLDYLYSPQFKGFLLKILRNRDPLYGGVFDIKYPHAIDVFIVSAEMIVIHEMMHTYHGGRCADHSYHFSNNILLAQRSPTMALQNADNMAYFTCLIRVVLGKSTMERMHVPGFMVRKYWPEVTNIAERIRTDKVKGKGPWRNPQRRFREYY